MPDRPRPSLARLLGQAVLTTLALTTGGALLVVGGAGMADVQDPRQPHVRELEPVRSPEHRMMERLDCSTSGFGGAAEPRSAIVRGPGGKVRAVTFAEGWTVHTDAGSRGTLVAVCLRPLR